MTEHQSPVHKIAIPKLMTPRVSIGIFNYAILLRIQKTLTKWALLETDALRTAIQYL